MNELTLDVMMQRVTRLERAHRWWKVLGTGAVAILGLVVLLGATDRREGRVVQEIRAKQFTLVDEDGKTRAGLFIGKGQMTRFELINQDGQIHVVLTAGREIASLALGVGMSLEDTRAHATFFVKPDGVASLLLGDKFGDRVGLSKKGLGLLDENGKVRAILRLATDGTPSLVLTDDNGIDRAVLGHTTLKTTLTDEIQKRSASSLVLFDRDGNVLWRVP